MAHLGPDALDDLRGRFEEYDDDGDGRIDFAEFVELLDELGDELSREEALLAFEGIDMDGNGAVTFEEFVKWWTA
jgi:Ca2+-binding EF-hand superfamily protein